MRYIKIFELYNNELKADQFAIKLKVNDNMYQYIKKYLTLHNGLKYLELFTFFLSSIDTETLVSLYETIHKYSNLLKERKIYPLEYLDMSKNSFKQYELLSDAIFKAMQENDKKKFAYSFISNKYKHLLNDKIINLLYTLKDKSNRNELQGRIFNKLAIIKTSDDLLDRIEEVVNENPYWNKKYILDTIKNSGIGKVLYNKNNNILIDIQENYDLLCDLVCKDKDIKNHNWCIVRSDGTFNSYILDYKKILVYFDFDLSENDANSYIGMQVAPVSNTIISAYDSYDDRFDITSNIPKIVKYIKGYTEDEVVKKYGKKNGEDSITPWSATEFGLIKYMRYYLDELASPSELKEKGYMLVKQACNNGNCDMLMLLLSNKYIVDALKFVVDDGKILKLLVRVTSNITDANVLNNVINILQPFTGIQIGDLVLSDGKYGLVMSNIKYEDEQYVVDVCIRSRGGDIVVLDISEIELVDSSNSSPMSDVEAYTSIAKKHGITLNPKYEEYLNYDEDEDWEYNDKNEDDY